MKKSSVWIICHGLLLLVILVIPACYKAPQRTDKKGPELTELQKSIQIGEICALATGDAYLVSDEGVFYISSGRAIRVNGLPPSRVLVEVYPLSDGGAILRDAYSDPPALFILRQDVATLVIEEAGYVTNRSDSLNSNSFYFAEAQRLKIKLKESEEKNYQEEPQEIYDDR